MTGLEGPRGRLAALTSLLLVATVLSAETARAVVVLTCDPLAARPGVRVRARTADDPCP